MIGTYAYGTCKLAKGEDPAGQNVFLTEDVITTGGPGDEPVYGIPERQPRELMRERASTHR